MGVSGVVVDRAERHAVQGLPGERASSHGAEKAEGMVHHPEHLVAEVDVGEPRPPRHVPDTVCPAGPPPNQQDGDHRRRQALEPTPGTGRAEALGGHEEDEQDQRAIGVLAHGQHHQRGPQRRGPPPRRVRIGTEAQHQGNGQKGQRDRHPVGRDRRRQLERHRQAGDDEQQRLPPRRRHAQRHEDDGQEGRKTRQPRREELSRHAQPDVDTRLRPRPSMPGTWPGC